MLACNRSSLQLLVGRGKQVPASKLNRLWHCARCHERTHTTQCNILRSRQYCLFVQLRSKRSLATCRCQCTMLLLTSSPWMASARFVMCHSAVVSTGELEEVSRPPCGASSSGEASSRSQRVEQAWSRASVASTYVPTYSQVEQLVALPGATSTHTTLCNVLGSRHFCLFVQLGSRPLLATCRGQCAMNAANSLSPPWHPLDSQSRLYFLAVSSRNPPGSVPHELFNVRGKCHI